MKDILIKSYNRDAVNYDDKFRALQFAKYKNLFDTSYLNSVSYNKSVVDLGCGTALFREFLAESDHRLTYYGVDKLHRKNCQYSLQS